MTSCAIYDYPPGPVTGPDAVTGEPCDWPADIVITTVCPSGHTSRTWTSPDQQNVVSGTCRGCEGRATLAISEGTGRAVSDYTWPLADENGLCLCPAGTR